MVKQLSSGTPEVCNYPFTTRSIKMGHFYIDGKKHQVGRGACEEQGRKEAMSLLQESTRGGEGVCVRAKERWGQVPPAESMRWGGCACEG